MSKKILLIGGCLLILFSQSFAQHIDLTGTWEGKLSVSGIELRLVFHIEKDESGYSGTMDSPDQGGFGIKLGKIIAENDSVIITVPSVYGSYEGNFKSESKLVGSWKQGAANLPLDVELQSEENVVKAPDRPQEPKPPFPYPTREVEIENAEDGITLAGTLSIPKGSGPFPGAILVTGSGPQNRDEELLGHKPFLVLSDYLTRHGIAVLRYDDRGVGKSTGEFGSATSEDFATDALSALKTLEKFPEINKDNIGIIGHSEGGLIAPMVAASSDDVDFIVLLAAPGLNGEQILYLQSRLIARASGAEEEIIKQSVGLSKQAYQIVIDEPDSTKASDQLSALVDEYLEDLGEEEKTKAQNNRETLISGLNRINNPWFRYFLIYEPSSSLEKVKCPVLALNGEKDLQVPPKENLEAIENALKKGGNDQYTIHELKGLNHLFQHSETGAPSEYAQIEETFAEEAMKIVSDWILKVSSN